MCSTTLQLRQKVHSYLYQVNAVKSSEHAIALGFAIGSFLAIIPLFGLSVLFAMLVVLLYKDVNKLALFGAIAFWNPFTLIPVYYASFEIGDFLFGNAPIIEYDLTFADHVFSFTRRFLAGNALLAFGLSCLAYTLMRCYVKYVRKRD
ncbi:hypothetical protein COU76_02660 [Candidatus Peregrinibacteria bacterium CG10_big_fil_rev_8_21_14_0_10_49_10]|nr:MAG: hypothetical protein COU76_02660 [Candidatus Peregrinibacteria bacterium CG10_big_fil_rev_8_21_14_0_10_49_10]